MCCLSVGFFSSNVQFQLDFRITYNIGLNKGYSDEAWSQEELKSKLSKAQHKLKDNHNILLSAKVTLCDIVFLGQDEPSVTLSFINYPKFPVTEDSFKKGVSFIAEELMIELKQNRIVIVFDDETLMLEKSDEIDKNIDLT